MHKHSNPLFHVLRINIIFIHKNSGEMAVALVKATLRNTKKHAPITFMCHAGRLQTCVHVFFFAMEGPVGGRWIWSREKETIRSKRKRK